MTRSRRDILDTESMLYRLTQLLAHHLPANATADYRDTRAGAESLRRISMALHRWHELECGDSNSFGSWAIVRGHWDTRPAKFEGKEKEFRHDYDGRPFLERHHYRHGRGLDSVTYSALPDRETGARKRLARILAHYPTLTAYVQTDPRGCALYVLKPGDVPEGADVSSCYSRGMAVYR